MAHWSRPQTSNFCIAPVPPKWLLCAHPAEDKAISEPTVITWRIPKGRTQAISYTKKNQKNLEQAFLSGVFFPGGAERDGMNNLPPVKEGLRWLRKNPVVLSATAAAATAAAIYSYLSQPEAISRTVR